MDGSTKMAIYCAYRKLNDIMRDLDEMRSVIDDVINEIDIAETESKEAETLLKNVLSELEA